MRGESHVDVKHRCVNVDRLTDSEQTRGGVVFDMRDPWVFSALSVPVLVKCPHPHPGLQASTSLHTGTSIGNLHRIRVRVTRDVTVLRSGHEDGGEKAMQEEKRQCHREAGSGDGGHWA